MRDGREHDEADRGQRAADNCNPLVMDETAHQQSRHVGSDNGSAEEGDEGDARLRRRQPESPSPGTRDEDGEADERHRREEQAHGGGRNHRIA